MKKTKVLLLLPSLSEGGGQHMVYELFVHMDRTMFEPMILCYEGRTGSALEQKADAVGYVEYLNAKGKVTLRKVNRVFRAIKVFQPDVIHAHLGGMIYAMLWTLLKRDRKVIITAHTEAKKAFNIRYERLLRYLLNRRRNDVRIAAISETNFHELCTYLNVGEDICVQVNNGIQTGRFYREPHEGFVFINVGRQDENKNQAAIIEVFERIHAKNSETRLLLLGDGPCHEALMQEVMRRGLTDAVTLTGMVADVENYYAVSDVYVQSSHIEGLPLSVLEAMAAGLPVVSTNVGGLKDLVNTNGILVPDHDLTALEKAMHYMTKVSADEYAYMVKQSIQCVQQYTSQSMAKAYEKMYRQICK